MPHADELNPAYVIRTGGLYRCCFNTIQEQRFEAVPVEGTTLGCSYCHDTMIYRRGAWEWNQGDKATA